MTTDTTSAPEKPNDDHSQGPSLPQATNATQSPPSTPSAAPTDAPPKYLPERQARLPSKLSALPRLARQLGSTFAHLLRHTLSAYAPAPHAAVELSLSAPAGKIRGEQLAVCKEIAADSVARLDKLEQKSTTLLSVIAVVAPLTASAAVFIKKQSLPAFAGWVTLSLDVLGTVSVLLAFVAVLRALAVRGHQALFLNTVIDPESDRIREYDEDFYGRGLLYTAAHRQAVCDHIADFVRASQVFLVVGVALATVAALPALIVVHDEPTKVAGTFSLDGQTVRALQAPATRELAAHDIRLRQLETAAESLAALRSATAVLQREITALRADIHSRRTRQRGANAPGVRTP